MKLLSLKIVLPFLALLILASILLVLFYMRSSDNNSTHSQTNEEIPVKIYVYKKGQKLEPDQSSQIFNELRNESENQLSISNDALYEGVSSENIKSIINKETAVEVRYNRPILLKNDHFNKNIELDRLMIPITGQYSGMILYGVGQYSSGPYSIRPSGIDKISNIVGMINK